MQAKRPSRQSEAPSPAGLASRKICFEILRQVNEGKHLDEALRLANKLSDRDRRFVRLLATTYLRRAGQIDAVLRAAMPRQPSGKTRNATLVLAIGIAQLLFLETGSHAAVNSTVDLMRAAGFDRLTGLANAVMRRLTRDGQELLARTSAADNLPDWIYKSWIKQFGKSPTIAIMEQAMRPPTLDITPAANADEWAEKLDGRLINQHTIRREFDGDPALLTGFAEGAWWVQDAAAALPATLLGTLTGKTVIDLCAAPGGKTAQLIASGAKVTAIDNAPTRLRILKGNLDRLSMTARMITADGRDFTPDEQVDAVLIDAPCSATGTLRRRPDVLHHRSPQDVSALAIVQNDLLRRAIGWVVPGGSLIYVTCSLQFEEGEKIIDDLLNDVENGKMTGIALDPISPVEAGDFAAAIKTEGKLKGTLRVRPDLFADIGGVDGFFIARLKIAPRALESVSEVKNK
ncbi:MAG: MFS transporter [Bacteroidetes bacterium]|nr:MFS transporter [Bacteroidota bacterium]